MGKNVYLQDVATLRVDREKCIGCGMCLKVCPHAVLALSEARISIIDRDACMECGACAMNCPVEAIAVQAGVGCAQAVINAILGRRGCCTIEEHTSQGGPDSCC
jgi:NAD-dependent dihydropyrimidine dehydrogenase PreA subunit